MYKSVVAIIILVLATLFLPFWIQIILYPLAIIFIRHRAWLLLPALFADAWYAPVRAFSWHDNLTTVLVLSMLAVYFLIITNTRVTQRYGLEKK